MLHVMSLRLVNTDLDLVEIANRTLAYSSSDMLCLT